MSLKTLTRRRFLKISVASPFLPTVPINPIIAINRAKNMPKIHFTTDGLNLTPTQYSELLLKLAQEHKAKQDDYSLGGCVEDLENKFAKLLGKEQAIFMPTGTLANHLAIRTLTEQKSRVLVQKESHIYNDSGDSVQILSGLNLIALAPNKSTFTLDEVKNELERTASGRVASQVGTIVIETPVRRLSGEMFDYKDLVEITAYAQRHNIKTHLDGARLFIASAYSGISPAEYSSHFDTVYISLYKYFNAAAGAILAGSRTVLENMFHIRRMFGGGLSEAWPYAAVANHYLDGFPERFKQAVKTAEQLFEILKTNSHFQIEKIPNGTNIYKLKMINVDSRKFREALKGKSIELRSPSTEFNGFWLYINESINQLSAEKLAQLFIDTINEI